MKKSKQSSLPQTVRSLTEVVDRVLDSVESRDIRTICNAVMFEANVAEWRKWADQNLIAGVRNVLRSRDKEGLPRGVSLNGQYVSPEQMMFPGYVQWAFEMACRGHDMFARAREIAEICQQKTGRAFDPEVVIQGAVDGDTLNDVMAKVS